MYMAFDDIKPTRRTFLVAGFAALMGGKANAQAGYDARQRAGVLLKPEEEAVMVGLEASEGAAVAGTAAAVIERAGTFALKHKISPSFGHHETDRERYERELRDREEQFRKGR
jgi:hypothetical protein